MSFIHILIHTYLCIIIDYLSRLITVGKKGVETKESVDQYSLYDDFFTSVMARITAKKRQISAALTGDQLIKARGDISFTCSAYLFDSTAIVSTMESSINFLRISSGENRDLFDHLDLENCAHEGEIPVPN